MTKELYIPKPIGIKIKEARQVAGLTQEQLGALIGTTRSGICRLEDPKYTGHSVLTLAKVAVALNVELSIDLIDKEPER